MANDNVQNDHTLTKAGEDYLEAIYRIALEQPDDDKSVRSVDIAESLDVSKASVNKALSQLKEQDMVEQSRYGRVTLTKEGEANARTTWRAHRALRTFLEEDLGVDTETADTYKSACHLSLSAAKPSFLQAHVRCAEPTGLIGERQTHEGNYPSSWSRYALSTCNKGNP